MHPRSLLIIAPLAVLLLGGLFTCLMWSDGPPMWWVLRGRHFERVVVRWSGKKLDSRDPKLVNSFASALRQGSDVMPYPTRCLPDDSAQWKQWSVTLFDQNGASFEADAGLDGCGVFYVPSVDCSYRSNPDLMFLANRAFKLPSDYSPFIQ